MAKVRLAPDSHLATLQWKLDWTSERRGCNGPNGFSRLNMMAATPKLSKSAPKPGGLSIASALRARRKRMGLTLQELANKSGLSAPFLSQVERDHILRALAASNWVIGGSNGAAARLGMKRTSLVYRMKKLRISRSAGFPRTGTVTRSPADA